MCSQNIPSLADSFIVPVQQTSVADRGDRGRGGSVSYPGLIPWKALYSVRSQYKGESIRVMVIWLEGCGFILKYKFEVMGCRSLWSDCLMGKCAILWPTTNRNKHFSPSILLFVKSSPRLGILLDTQSEVRFWWEDCHCIKVLTLAGNAFERFLGMSAVNKELTETTLFKLMSS